LALTRAEISKLNRVIKLVERVLDDDVRSVKAGRANGKKPRIRRTGRDLIQFRRMLKAERKKGTPVSVIARKHGISTAYIYMLP